MAISMLKIRRPLGRLIFNMGIAIPGKTVFLIETAPWLQWIGQEQLQDETKNILKDGGISVPYIKGLTVINTHLLFCVTSYGFRCDSLF